MQITTRQSTAQFIAVEGLDGSGKSTLVRDLARRLGATSMTTPSPPVRAVREAVIAGLSGSPVARQAFYLATLAHASDTIAPMLRAGSGVVLDRYLLSTMVYAVQRGEHLRWRELEESLLPAHVTVFLDVPLAVRRARLEARGMSLADIESIDPPFDAGVRRLYMDWSRHPVAGRFVHLQLQGTETPDHIVARVLGLLRSCQDSPVRRVTSA